MTKLQSQTRVTALAAALRKLSMVKRSDTEIVAMAEALSLFYDKEPTAGRVPPRFRETTQTMARKELKAFASQAARLAALLSTNESEAKMRADIQKRLARTLDSLHQTAIVMLADNGFFARNELARIVKAPSPGRGEQKRAEIELLELAASAAEQAIKSDSSGSVAQESVSLGAPENRRATALARLLSVYYERLTGKQPALTVNPFKEGNPTSGPFLQLVAEAFRILNVRAAPEAYCRKTIRKRKRRLKERISD